MIETQLQNAHPNATVKLVVSGDDVIVVIEQDGQLNPMSPGELADEVDDSQLSVGIPTVHPTPTPTMPPPATATTVVMNPASSIEDLATIESELQSMYGSNANVNIVVVGNEAIITVEVEGQTIPITDSIPGVLQK